jgi:hypothetical protein
MSSCKKCGITIHDEGFSCICTNDAYKNKNVKFAVSYFQNEIMKRDLRILELQRKCGALQSEVYSVEDKLRTTDFELFKLKLAQKPLEKGDD